MNQQCSEFWSNIFSMPDLPIPQPTGVVPSAVAADPSAGSAATTPSATEGAAEAASGGEARDFEDICGRCEDKYLLISIDRHTKKSHGGVWDCTLGDLLMEVVDMPTSPTGSGSKVFECFTIERGAAGGLAAQRRAESGRSIAAADVRGVNMHHREKIQTYHYSTAGTAFDHRPRMGMGVYGNGNSTISGARTGVAWHHGSSHRWSIGCILLSAERGAESGGRWRFGVDQSYATTLTFREKTLSFAGHPTSRTPSPTPNEVRLDRVIVRITESF